MLEVSTEKSCFLGSLARCWRAVQYFEDIEVDDIPPQVVAMPLVCICRGCSDIALLRELFARRGREHDEVEDSR